MRILQSVILITLFYALGWQLKLATNSAPVEIEDEAFEYKIPRKKAPKTSQLAPSVTKRTPASVRQYENYEVSNRLPVNDSLPEIPQDEQSTPEIKTSSSYASNFDNGYRSSNPQYVPNRSSSSSRSPSSASSESESAHSNFYGGGILSNTSPPLLEDTKSPTAAKPASPQPASLNCSANREGGNFSNPINVSISCTASASIQYCLSENGCCDPRTGVSYSSPISVGKDAKDYCLSYIGQNSNGTSSLKTHIYNFSASAPDLETLVTKTHYQTTQLLAKVQVSSQNFSSPYHQLSVVNLKTHDPSSSGLNLSCNDIDQNFTTMTTPVPHVILADESTDQFEVNNVLAVNLGLFELVYGTNHITSLIKSIDGELVCSNQMITLNDFEFFDPSPMNRVTNSQDQLEMIGGFTETSFLEEEVYRGPAAEDEQELRQGLVSIFYK